MKQCKLDRIVTQHCNPTIYSARIVEYERGRTVRKGRRPDRARDFKGRRG